MSAIIVTRHPALVEYLIEIGYIADDNSCAKFEHATPEIVTDNHVIGVLPHHLSCLTSSYTEVPMDIPFDKRGQELTLEDMRLYAGKPVRYIITRDDIPF